MSDIYVYANIFVNNIKDLIKYDSGFRGYNSEMADDKQIRFVVNAFFKYSPMPMELLEYEDEIQAFVISSFMCGVGGVLGEGADVPKMRYDDEGKQN